MRILITNDDGIESEGLKILLSFAKGIGECTVVAPKREQSGKSHSVELHKSFEVKKIKYEGVDAYYVDSTPPDCVRFALSLSSNYDLLFSGINRGYNVGADILYSGTCGAVFEGCVLGIKNSVAFSTHSSSFSYSRKEDLITIWDYITKYNLLSHSRLLNINIPPEWKNIKITRQGGRFFHDDFIETSHEMVKAKGRSIYKESEPSLSFDTDSVLRDKSVSITPLTIDRTDVSSFKILKELTEK